MIQTDGPIVYIDDDEDDQLLFNWAVTSLKLPNQIRSFYDGQAALNYLLTTKEKPLMILCDVNMPTMNGLELRNYIDATPQLRQKAIPFIFYTTDASPDLVKLAYEGTIQGYYDKVHSLVKLKDQLGLIVAYWQSCVHPNNFV